MYASNSQPSAASQKRRRPSIDTSSEQLEARVIAKHREWIGGTRCLSFRRIVEEEKEEEEEEG